MHPLLTSDALGLSASSEARSHFNMLLSQKGCMEQVCYGTEQDLIQESVCTGHWSVHKKQIICCAYKINSQNQEKLLKERYWRL